MSFRIGKDLSLTEGLDLERRLASRLRSMAKRTLGGEKE
jgi:hypothetical protein